jgi:ketosteroid isomerase-like protein
VNLVDRFLAYADAFEKTLTDDDWSRLAPYFTADAVLDNEPVARGRDAVLAKLKSGVEEFDRRMDSRTLDLHSPSVDGDTVTVQWTCRFTKAGVPDLVLTGSEMARFDGDRIARMWDVLAPGVEATMGRWLAEHGAALQGG